jgi:hypothetical protein
MIELSSIEMNLANLIGPACPDDRLSKPLRETSLILDAPSRDRERAPWIRYGAAGEIGNHKPRSSDFRYDLIIDLVDVILLIDSKRLITCIENSMCEVLAICRLHAVVEPHRDKTLIAQDGLRALLGRLISGHSSTRPFPESSERLASADPVTK